MFKNQFRQLNFVPMNGHDVVDVWTKAKPGRVPISPEFTAFLQAIYRKHGWPDLSKYHKDECLAEVERELAEKYPKHHLYYFRTGA